MLHHGLRLWISLLLCTAGLSGCALFASRPEAPTPRLSPVREFIVSHIPGEPEATGTVSDPEFGLNLRIVLEQEFLSASGETCRRASLFAPDGGVEMVVMCRKAAGDWILAPRVWGQGLRPQREGAGHPVPPARAGNGANPPSAPPAQAGGASAPTPAATQGADAPPSSSAR